jgi:hypothetical protein
MTDLDLIVISYLLKLAGALGGIAMLGACAFVGAKVCGIDIKKAVDHVEQHPVAFSIFVVGHFIGAAFVMGSIWG